MQQNARIAIAAHLHVLLRRNTGRVVDVEWMAQDEKYAKAILQLARNQAQETGAVELADWATKFEKTMQVVEPLEPAPSGIRSTTLPLEPDPPARPSFTPLPEYETGYVGGLR